MYELDYSTEELYLCRFMIDKKYQRNGYGVETLNILKRIAESDPNIKKKTLSTSPNNSRGIKIYESFGFVDTNNYLCNLYTSV